MQAENIKDTQNPAEGAAENAEAPAEEKVNAGEAAAGNAENAQPEEAKPEEHLKDEKDAKIEELQNRLMRLQADFENFRRRNAAERGRAKRKNYKRYVCYRSRHGKNQTAV